MNIKQRILPAGKYIIGDPCYLFDDAWDDILGENEFFELDLDKQQINKLGVAVMSTEHGDGSYYDSNDFEYSVDAGLIGIMPYELLDWGNTMSEDSLLSGNYMRVIEFNHPILVEVYNYELRISHTDNITTNILTLDTKGYDDYDYDDDYDDDYDEDYEYEEKFTDDYERY
jgi:hypothetical protein